MLRILTPDGELTGDAPFDIEMTRRLYRAMIEARTYDRKCTALQKQGRLATYAPLEGQEGAQVGAAAALYQDDWVVGTYRDAAAMWMQGYPWELLILGRTGDERGGRPPEHVPVLPPSITVGAHMIHAVGLAWAAKLQGEPRVAMTFFGDGATSEGDFHEAMNFAGVFGTGTVFVCQNNGYAISMSRARQTASETIAQKAEAYGMPGVLVDGNDLFAVFSVARDAVTRARNGGGPTLIEAVTYRMGPHTTNDDPRRYRSESEEIDARSRDPLRRVRYYLERNGAWDPSWQEKVDETAAANLERAVLLAESLPAFERAEIFDAMFEELTPQLRAQAGGGA